MRLFSIFCVFLRKKLHRVTLGIGNKESLLLDYKKDKNHRCEHFQLSFDASINTLWFSFMLYGYGTTFLWAYGKTEDGRFKKLKIKKIA